MKKIIPLCLLSSYFLLSGITSCSKEDVNNQKDSMNLAAPCLNWKSAPTISINGPTTAAVNEQVNVKVRIGVINGCGSYAGVEQQPNGNTINYKAIAKYEGCLCTANAPIVEGTHMFRATQAGTYILKFWKTDTSTVNHTIVVQ
jgi:hypothetical protein